MSFFKPTFQAKSNPVNVRFGAGSRLELADDVRSLNCQRAIVLSTPPQAETSATFVKLIGDLAVGTYDKAAMHTPVEITQDALSHVEKLGADCIVSVGGGSTIGLGKALALRTDLPQVVVPTTYAGSEATAILGQTEGGQKTTLSDPKVQPEVIIYDPELLTTLPVPMSVTSALNAMAHAAEALYAQNRNPVSSLLAREGLAAFVRGLPQVIEAPKDVSARGETLYGAWLCGTVLGQVGMALHHKLCHTLGGTFDLPHAETHAILLAHSVAYNESAVPTLLTPLADVLGADRAGRGLYDFARRLGAPQALKDIGLKETDLDRAADLACQNPYWNPRPVERDPIRSLLQSAWSGAPPDDRAH